VVRGLLSRCPRNEQQTTDTAIFGPKRTEREASHNPTTQRGGNIIRLTKEETKTGKRETFNFVRPETKGYRRRGRKKSSAKRHRAV